jgi:hypothetical protein
MANRETRDTPLLTTTVTAEEPLSGNAEGSPHRIKQGG